MSVAWKDAPVVMEWPDGHKIVRVKTRADLETLSCNGGGCAKDHYFWTEVVNPPMEYFFVLMRPGDEVSVILLTKRLRYKGKTHPREREVPNYIRSDMYDRFADRYDEDDLAYYKSEVTRAKAAYERVKEEAIAQYGPLKAGHPQKFRVDDYNRYYTEACKVLENYKKVNEIKEGRTFKWKGQRLFITQVAGRGVDYNGKGKYNEKLMEFLGKEI